MHAVHTMAGVQKRVQHLPGHAVVLCQRVDGRRNGLAIGLYQGRTGAAMCFALDVLREQLGAVFDTLRGLRSRARRGHKARRQGS